MNLIKKSFFLVVIILFTFFCFNVQSNAIKNGTEYSQDQLFDVNYIESISEFRACWVSPLVSDISRFRSQESYKQEYIKILENMKLKNMNAIIFHVRIMNDALYKSNYNNWSSYYNTNPNWDALNWLIETSHNYGIEFHAWMNPYRVSTQVSTSLSKIITQFPKSNPASKISNLLVGDSVIILNPGIPDVQSFLVRCCMELVEKYPVDAIHFDDYFYASGIEDYETYRLYGSNQGIEQFRRDSVDTFIRKLSNEIKDYNKQHNKCVQLGISPTPVWLQGDGIVTYDETGKAITNGSKTPATQGHYGDYLYCDTLKWINEEWIDYIVPQCYNGMSQGNMNYAKEVEWWSKVVKNKPCNLYIGLGIYRVSQEGDWKNSNELKNELEIINQYDDCDGYVYFSYRHVVSSNARILEQFKQAKDYYNDIRLLPTIKRFSLPKKDAVTDCYVETKKLDDSFEHIIHFKKQENDKYYALFTTFENELKLIDIFNQSNDEISYPIKTANEHALYYVCSIGYDNTLGNPTKLDTSIDYKIVYFYDYNNNLINKQLIIDDSQIVYPDAEDLEGYDFVKWTRDDNVFHPDYKKKEYTINFYDNSKLLGSINKLYLDKLTLKEIDYNTLIDNFTIDDTNKLIGYKFSGWFIDDCLIDEDIEVVNDLNLQIKKELVIYKLKTIIGPNKKTIEFTIENIPTLEELTKEGYEFIGWYNESTNSYVSSLECRDYELNAIFKEIKKNGCNDKTIALVYSLLALLFIMRRKKKY